MRSRTLVVIALFVVGAYTGAGAQRLSAVDRAALVAQLWSVARTTSATAWRAHLDWDAALADGLRAATPPQSDLHFLRVLRQLVALVGDGQADVLAPSAVRSRLARPPLELTCVERRPFLLDYADNAELRVAHPDRRSEILAVQGVPAEDWIRDSVLPRVGGATAAARWERAVTLMLEGEKGTAVHLVLQRPNGEHQGISVTRTVAETDRWPLAPQAVTVESLPGGIALVPIHSLADADVLDRFDHALTSGPAPRAVIVDLRGVGDGHLDNAYGLVARLAPGPMPAPRRRMALYRPALGLLERPESSAAWYWLPPDTINPRRDRAPFTGPLAVLSDATTAGAAEDLLAVVRSSGRGVILGATSAGSPGEALIVPLVSGWSVELSVLGDALPDGTPLGGTGVAPDIPITPSVDDFLAGRDVVRQRAEQDLTAP